MKYLSDALIRVLRRCLDGVLERYLDGVLDGDNTWMVTKSSSASTASSASIFILLQANSVTTCPKVGKLVLTQDCLPGL